MQNSRGVTPKVFILLICTFCLLKKTTAQIVSPEKKSFSIHGNLTGINSGMIMLSYSISDKIILDSANVSKGRFYFKGAVPSPISAYLYLKDSRNQRLHFYLENSVINIQANKDSLQFSKVTGSVSNADKDSIEAFLVSYYEARNSLNKIRSFASKEQLTAVLANIDKIYEALPTAQRKLIVDYAFSHPASYAITDRLNINFTNDQTDLPLLKKVYNNFSPSVKMSQGGINIAELIQRIERVQIGNKAPDFTLPDEMGKQVKLSSFSGKYILLDFWASWCVPCREESPFLVEAFKKYQDKNFTIISISLDTEKDKQKWLDAIIKDKLTWTHLSSLKGYEEEGVRGLYSVQGIPDNFLIDPNGKIIARGLRGVGLEKFLSETFK